jgi:glycosyltransferase involved in cell wall biosynthesis
MVSVIVPTYNREKTILRAINSILKQTYKDIEIIIIDDYSNDNTQEVVKSLNNDKIKYIKQDKNRGACAARNIGIKLAKGEYIAFLDSDDEWLPEKIEKQIKFLKTNNADIVFCSYVCYVDNKKLIIPNKKIDTNVLYEKLLYGNFITTGSILGKAKCFNDVNFDLNLPRFQDWDLVINMTQKYNIQHLPEILTINYVQKDSISKDDRKAIEALKIIYSKLLHLNCIDNSVKANFYIQMGMYAIKSNIPAINYYKESLKNKITIKTFIKYIICLLGCQKFLLRNKI